MLLELGSLSDADWRERIGNAVPPAAAAAVASTMGMTLMPAWIAANNDTAWLTDALDDDVIPSVTASLVAGLFGRTEDEINRDLTLRTEAAKDRGIDRASLERPQIGTRVERYRIPAGPPQGSGLRPRADTHRARAMGPVPARPCPGRRDAGRGGC